MKKFFAGVILLFVFLGSFIAFFPKTSLVELLSKSAQKEHVTLQIQKIESHPFSFALHGVSLFYEGVEVAKIADVFVGFGGIDIGRARGVGSFKQAMPIVKEAHICYMPKEFLTLVSDAGSLRGTLDVSKRVALFRCSAKEQLCVKYKSSLPKMSREGDSYVFKVSF